MSFNFMAAVCSDFGAQENKNDHKTSKYVFKMKKERRRQAVKTALNLYDLFVGLSDFQV